jgi:hypothetical protein
VSGWAQRRRHEHSSVRQRIGRRRTSLTSLTPQKGSERADRDTNDPRTLTANEQPPDDARTDANPGLVDHALNGHFNRYLQGSQSRACA